jgi:hypothetical protein
MVGTAQERLCPPYGIACISPQWRASTIFWRAITSGGIGWLLPRVTPKPVADQDVAFVQQIEGDLGTIRGDINLLKWMNGITGALCFGILFKLFLH